MFFYVGPSQMLPRCLPEVSQMAPPGASPTSAPGASQMPLPHTSPSCLSQILRGDGADFQQEGLPKPVVMGDPVPGRSVWHVQHLYS